MPLFGLRAGLSQQHHDPFFWKTSGEQNSSEEASETPSSHKRKSRKKLSSHSQQSSPISLESNSREQDARATKSNSTYSPASKQVSKGCTPSPIASPSMSYTFSDETTPLNPVYVADGQFSLSQSPTTGVQTTDPNKALLRQTSLQDYSELQSSHHSQIANTVDQQRGSYLFSVASYDSETSFQMTDRSGFGSSSSRRKTDVSLQEKVDDLIEDQSQSNPSEKTSPVRHGLTSVEPPISHLSKPRSPLSFESLTYDKKNESDSPEIFSEKKGEESERDLTSKDEPLNLSELQEPKRYSSQNSNLEHESTSKRTRTNESKTPQPVSTKSTSRPGKKKTSSTNQMSKSVVITKKERNATENLQPIKLENRINSDPVLVQPNKPSRDPKRLTRLRHSVQYMSSSPTVTPTVPSANRTRRSTDLGESTSKRQGKSEPTPVVSLRGVRPQQRKDVGLKVILIDSAHSEKSDTLSDALRLSQSDQTDTPLHTPTSRHNDVDPLPVDETEEIHNNPDDSKTLRCSVESSYSFNQNSVRSSHVSMIETQPAERISLTKQSITLPADEKEAEQILRANEPVVSAVSTPTQNSRRTSPTQSFAVTYTRLEDGRVLYVPYHVRVKSTSTPIELKSYDDSDSKSETDSLSHHHSLKSLPARPPVLKSRPTNKTTQRSGRDRHRNLGSMFEDISHNDTHPRPSRHSVLIPTHSLFDKSQKLTLTNPPKLLDLPRYSLHSPHLTHLSPHTTPQMSPHSTPQMSPTIGTPPTLWGRTGSDSPSISESMTIYSTGSGSSESSPLDEAIRPYRTRATTRPPLPSQVVVGKVTTDKNRHHSPKEPRITHPRMKLFDVHAMGPDVSHSADDLIPLVSEGFAPGEYVSWGTSPLQFVSFCDGMIQGIQPMVMQPVFLVLQNSPSPSNTTVSNRRVGRHKQTVGLPTSIPFRSQTNPTTPHSHLSEEPFASPSRQANSSPRNPSLIHSNPYPLSPSVTDHRSRQQTYQDRSYQQRGSGSQTTPTIDREIGQRKSDTNSSSSHHPSTPSHHPSTPIRIRKESQYTISPSVDDARSPFNKSPAILRTPSPYFAHTGLHNPPSVMSSTDQSLTMSETHLQPRLHSPSSNLSLSLSVTGHPTGTTFISHDSFTDLHTPQNRYPIRQSATSVDTVPVLSATPSIPFVDATQVDVEPQPWNVAPAINPSTFRMPSEERQKLNELMKRNTQR
ncbi:hypothetical protein BLNAU_13336 [Blattamonas nauphoetae]|uniref:Uncharacterized protein n=1 Tax=Blattamonas nauphoetae TaxID=2049346 RepID=A0ABQ9XJ13_9EUKA|nr:hypothetical protein BLNAU_13336 [Blattamonas nauphoetae]